MGVQSCGLISGAAQEAGRPRRSRRVGQPWRDAEPAADRADGGGGEVVRLQRGEGRAESVGHGALLDAEGRRRWRPTSRLLRRSPARLAGGPVARRPRRPGVRLEAISTADKFNGADLGVRREWLPLFDRHGVDQVVCGDEHHYERSHPYAARSRAAPSPRSLQRPRNDAEKQSAVRVPRRVVTPVERAEQTKVGRSPPRGAQVLPSHADDGRAPPRGLPAPDGAPTLG
jgi:hypothetical protein